MTGNRTATTRGDGSGGGSASVRLLVGLLLLAVPLVGCADDGSGPSGADGEAMTAADGLEDARSVAEDWSQDAEFIGAGTLETDNGTPEQWPSEAPEFRPDENIGDGLTHQWVYTFKNDADERLTVHVTSEGETYQEPTQQEDVFMNSTIEDWNVSSSEAMDAAKEAEQDFKDTADAEDAEVALILGAGDRGNVGWLLDVKRASTDEQVTVIVDATTGDVQRFGRQ